MEPPCFFHILVVYDSAWGFHVFFSSLIHDTQTFMGKCAFFGPTPTPPFFKGGERFIVSMVSLANCFATYAKRSN